MGVKDADALKMTSSCGAESVLRSFPLPSNKKHTADWSSILNRHLIIRTNFMGTKLRLFPKRHNPSLNRVKSLVDSGRNQLWRNKKKKTRER
jgi:hypothetical protein